MTCWLTGIDPVTCVGMERSERVKEYITLILETTNKFEDLANTLKEKIKLTKPQNTSAARKKHQKNIKTSKHIKT